MHEAEWHGQASWRCTGTATNTWQAGELGFEFNTSALILEGSRRVDIWKNGNLLEDSNVRLNGPWHLRAIGSYGAHIVSDSCRFSTEGLGITKAGVHP
jgi:hypothetical protein